MLSIGTVAYQRNKVWVVKSAQDIDFNTELTFSLCCFNCWQLHFLDCYNLQKETCYIKFTNFEPRYNQGFCMEARTDVIKSCELWWIPVVYKLTPRAYYLSWPQSAPVDFAKSSFSKQILVTEWTSCLFHLLECVNRWSMQPLCRSWCLIFKLPKLCRFVNPWIYKVCKCWVVCAMKQH